MFVKTLQRWAWKIGFFISAWRWPKNEWVPEEFR